VRDIFGGDRWAWVFTSHESRPTWEAELEWPRGEVISLDDPGLIEVIKLHWQGCLRIGESLWFADLAEGSGNDIPGLDLDRLFYRYQRLQELDDKYVI
jgi:hypothetical protein